MSRHSFDVAVLFLSRQGCLVSRQGCLVLRHGICCNQLSCFSAFRNCRDINFFVTTFFLLFFSNFVMTEFPYVTTELLWLLNNLYRDRVFFCRDKLFFPSSYRWLRCLLRHRNLCCDRLDLTISILFQFMSRTNFLLSQ